MSEGSRNSSPNIHHQLHHLSTSTVNPAISTIPGMKGKHRGLSVSAQLLHPGADTEVRSDDVQGGKHQQQPAHQEHPAAHTWLQHQSGGAGQTISPTKPLPKHRRYSQSSQGWQFLTNCKDIKDTFTYICEMWRLSELKC